jgi:hypothetical protein
MKMYDNYSPLDLLHKPFSNAIFLHEINRLKWSPEFEDIRNADWIFVWKVLGLQLGVLLALMWLSSYRAFAPLAVPFFTVLVPVIVLFGPLVYTIAIDLRAVLLCVTFWHARTQADGLDLVRLTAPTDEALLTVLQVAGELNVWRGMRWEMALRGFDTIGGVATCVAFGIYLSTYLLLTSSDDVHYYDNAVVVLLAIWAIRLLLMYIREPLWRMRTLVALSITVASRIPETNAAILTASAAALFLKLMQLAGAAALFMITLAFTQTADGQEVPYQAISIWLIGSGLLTTPLVRGGYGLLHTVCTWLTLRTMQGADHLLPFTVHLYNEKRNAR